MDYSVPKAIYEVEDLLFNMPDFCASKILQSAYHVNSFAIVALVNC